MLDALLGRRELKERIEELTAERDRLSKRLEAESERRTEAVRDRQAAEERVNRLEDRIADLEGRVESSEDTGSGEQLSFRRTADLHGARLDAVLGLLESVDAGPEGAVTAVLPADGSIPPALGDHFGDHGRLLQRARPCIVYADDAAVTSVALRAPLPPDPSCEWADRFRVHREWFQPTGEHAIALVRSDVFALGVYDGTDRTAFEGFESDVMNDHSKGGFSQGRFERRRDEQIADHLDRCRDVIDERAVDRLIVLGQESLLPEFAGSAIRTAAVDATGPPREALESARRSFWTTRLFAI